MSGRKEEVVGQTGQIEVIDELGVNAATRMSPSKTNQPMDMEMIGVDLQPFAIKILINIPIALSSSSGTLKLGNPGNKAVQPLEQRAINKVPRKKWKRAKGKENVAPEHHGTSLIVAEQSSRKRQW